MSPNPIIYYVLYTSRHPWDHQFSIILGAKMQSERWSKQICQKSFGKRLQNSTRSAQRIAKVAPKPPRWVQDGARKHVKIEKKKRWSKRCVSSDGIRASFWCSRGASGTHSRPKINAKSHHDATQEQGFWNIRSENLR